jgi:hypothetical protein
MLQAMCLADIAPQTQKSLQFKCRFSLSSWRNKRTDLRQLQGNNHRKDSSRGYSIPHQGCQISLGPNIPNWENFSRMFSGLNKRIFTPLPFHLKWAHTYIGIFARYLWSGSSARAKTKYLMRSWHVGQALQNQFLSSQSML